MQLCGKITGKCLQEANFPSIGFVNAMKGAKAPLEKATPKTTSVPKAHPKPKHKRTRSKSEKDEHQRVYQYFKGRMNELKKIKFYT